MLGGLATLNKREGTMSVIYTRKSLAEHLRVSIRTVDRLRKNGLPTICMSGTIRFLQSDVDGYMDGRRISITEDTADVNES